jgi:hypothetical protein
MLQETRTCPSAPVRAPLNASTLPWDVPERTIIVEYVGGRWRVVTRDRAVATFRTREAALAHAQRIAALYIPQHTIVEREEPSSNAIAC